MSNVRPLRPATIIDGPSRKRDRTRAALLRAGEKLMIERSVDAVTIEEIATAANVAKGTFYNYFEDKEALQRDILDAMRAEIRAIAARSNAGVADPARRIIRMFLTVLRFAADHPDRGRFLNFANMAPLAVAEHSFEGMLVDISAGIADGRLKVSTAESALLLALGLQLVALARTACVGTSELASCSQQLAEMLLRGLGLPLEEAAMIASHEVDLVICRHDAQRRGGA